jgi:hypothetical protein
MEVKPVDCSQFTYLKLGNVVYFNQHTGGRNNVHWSKYTTLEGVVEIKMILRFKISTFECEFLK